MFLPVIAALEKAAKPRRPAVAALTVKNRGDSFGGNLRGHP
jgi:hypothetical protein